MIIREKKMDKRKRKQISERKEKEKKSPWPLDELASSLLNIKPVVTLHYTSLTMRTL